MSANEVDLNDPLNWFIADSMDDYAGRLHPDKARELVHRHNAYPILVSAVKEAIEALNAAGLVEKAESLKRRLQELGELEKP
jgi:hypothetical protein